ncbi:GFA family protein [Porphyrobacter sp. ULC335]|uniref:GFA family protein n=1 Tax=Porphyrobacter sp. ULC335 TaxID=2854260 RepID=UPI0024CA8307|nr:GFA family protein [Porphyrobacter sp. ULC335]UYV16587.1 GFA family protein [Porphyrobacter sp. ULC335]
MAHNSFAFTGGCQCGAIRYRIMVRSAAAHLCHCRMCQKASGNIFAALVCVPKTEVSWTRGSPAAWRSSSQVDRGFCPACGTPLFYDDVSSDTISFMVGSFDEPSRFPPDSHHGIESRVSWFASLSEIPDHQPAQSAERAEWANAIQRSNRQHPDHDGGLT